MTLHHRTLWISDVHLGTRGCKDEYLLDFLRHNDCERLYLVGDIVDFWKLKNGFYWPARHNEIVRAVLEKAARGTEVIYIPGNHDEIFRGYIGTTFNGVEIRERAIHRTADGRHLLVLHGDEFDGVVCSSRWLAVLGSEAYDLLLVVNRWFNHGRRLLGFPYWSMSAYIKHKVKNAVSFIFDFEKALMHAAEEEKLDGVVCGHIHHAAMHTLDNGITYCNTGDWVESCTALAESSAGELTVIRWVEESARLLEEHTLENCPDNGRLAPTS
ncbi:UDP-2,3-diacylglucosamine diphosphatase [Methylococcus sp. EFPC2]|uniref:UDP-2,3-diacylglucosamine diphosphatase n=1 Tax=Methylococcus sp. EFPC2 TaxID=2812648 RepID=UPI001966F042|nr:UDP-2,3-diacylglucosamine diphosphatase [Methylococcus sp. EFPC2]QSA96852.1 UDP-2,3-diacylglucosamine diphosphatase [Methylococcus sp. EFPC2]